LLYKILETSLTTSPVWCKYEYVIVVCELNININTRVPMIESNIGNQPDIVIGISHNSSDIPMQYMHSQGSRKRGQGGEGAHQLLN